MNVKYQETAGIAYSASAPRWIGLHSVDLTHNQQTPLVLALKGPGTGDIPRLAPRRMAMQAWSSQTPAWGRNAGRVGLRPIPVTLFTCDFVGKPDIYI